MSDQEVQGFIWIQKGSRSGPDPHQESCRQYDRGGETGMSAQPALEKTLPAGWQSGFVLGPNGESLLLQIMPRVAHCGDTNNPFAGG